MGLVRASTEVDIEELKGLVSVIFGEVAAELNVTKLRMEGVSMMRVPATFMESC